MQDLMQCHSITWYNACIVVCGFTEAFGSDKVLLFIFELCCLQSYMHAPSSFRLDGVLYACIKRHHKIYCYKPISRVSIAYYSISLYDLLLTMQLKFHVLNQLWPYLGICCSSLFILTLWTKLKRPKEQF